MNPVIKKFQFGQSTVTLETGRIARQASGAVLVTVDDDVTVLVTVVGAKTLTRAKAFSLCPFTTRKRLTLPVRSLAVSSSAKAVLPRKKP